MSWAIQVHTKASHWESFSPANGRLPQHPPRQSQPTGSVGSRGIVHYQPTSHTNVEHTAADMKVNTAVHPVGHLRSLDDKEDECWWTKMCNLVYNDLCDSWTLWKEWERETVYFPFYKCLLHNCLFFYHIVFHRWDKRRKKCAWTYYMFQIFSVPLIQLRRNQHMPVWRNSLGEAALKSAPPFSKLAPEDRSARRRRVKREI